MARMFAGRELPAPEERIPLAVWREFRAWMLENDPDAQEMLDWSNRIMPPKTSEDLAGEICWIILCAGKTAQAARTISAKIYKAMREGRPVVEAYGHKGRAAAIEMVWRDHARLFDEMNGLLGSELELLAWAEGLPWVGTITKYQLLKNLGADVCKPDIWLSRLAGMPDRPIGKSIERFLACQDLCLHLGASTGDKAAAVDSLLWLGCNKNSLVVDAMGGPVTFRPGPIARRSIYAAGAGDSSEIVAA